MSKPQPNIKRLVILGSLGLCFPIFLVVMAFFALSSDAKNQQEYDRIKQENLARIEARKKAEAQQIQSAAQE